MIEKIAYERILGDDYFLAYTRPDYTTRAVKAKTPKLTTVIRSK